MNQAADITVSSSCAFDVRIRRYMYTLKNNLLCLFVGRCAVSATPAIACECILVPTVLGVEGFLLPAKNMSLRNPVCHVNSLV